MRIPKKAFLRWVEDRYGMRVRRACGRALREHTDELLDDPLVLLDRVLHQSAAITSLSFRAKGNGSRAIGRS